MSALLLAFDTSTPVGSVAVARGGELLGEVFIGEPRRQAAELVPAIAAVLGEVGVGRDQLGGVVVGRGPGSFTGVRIAAATARGLAAGLGIPVWPRSSLAAAAVAAWPVAATPIAAAPSGATMAARYVVFDAGGDRVYAAAYRLVAGTLETVRAPSADTVGGLLRSAGPRSTFVGDGALRHARTLEAAGHTVLPEPAGLPTAAALLALGALLPAGIPEPPHSRWQPEYLRGTSARPGG